MRNYITEYMLQRVTLLVSVTFSFGLQILARRNVNFKMHMLLGTQNVFGSRAGLVAEYM